MATLTTRPTARTVPISRILPLTVAAFAAGTDDMVIAGVLPEIAADLRVSEAQAGQLVTVFALVYGLGTPLVAVIGAKLPRRRLLATGLALFVIFNLLAAAAPSYGTLFALRILAAASAAAITPAALAIAASAAPADRKGRYLALVIAGITTSLVIGVPIGTWLGGYFGWQATMLFVAGLGALALVTVAAVPAIPAGPSLALRGRLAPLASGRVLRLILFVVVAGCGGMMQITYVFPVLRAAGDQVAYQQIAMIIALAGLVGAVAAWLGGLGADRWGPVPTLRSAELGHGTVLLGMAALAWQGGFPLPMLALAVMALALFAWSLTPPLQSLLLRLAPQAGTEVLALQTSGLFVGASLGGLLGGFLLEQWHAAVIPLAGGLLQFAALFLLRQAVRADSPPSVGDTGW